MRCQSPTSTCMAGEEGHEGKGTEGAATATQVARPSRRRQMLATKGLHSEPRASLFLKPVDTVPNKELHSMSLFPSLFSARVDEKLARRLAASTSDAAASCCLSSRCPPCAGPSSWDSWHWLRLTSRLSSCTRRPRRLVTAANVRANMTLSPSTSAVTLTTRLRFRRRKPPQAATAAQR